jgi:thiol-disulfide isomerase/thioredoxin
MVVAAVAPAQTLFGRRAPGFSLPDLTLKQHDLQDYRGKIVIIDFMKTDCPHCQALTKILEQVKAKYGDKIQVLSVVNPPDNQQTVTRYIAAYKATNPFLFDCGQMTASFLQITPKNPSVSLPHIVVVDKNGMIRRDLAEAAASLQNITGAIDPLLK